MIGQRLGIAGVGLIGGSIALRARASGAFVTGFDRDDAAARRARERGGLDRIAPDLMTLAAACDLLVIALPVDAAIAALSELVGVEGPALIIDVASVKLPLRQLAARLPRYIGTGSRRPKPRSSRAQSGPTSRIAIAAWSPACVPSSRRWERGQSNSRLTSTMSSSR